eukprot:m.121196 g.121196  ORF g.121196 m.121196 type:complete len:214 (-) comp11076_c0_seq2:548-1189(-)
MVVIVTASVVVCTGGTAAAAAPAAAETTATVAEFGCALAEVVGVGEAGLAPALAAEAVAAGESTVILAGMTGEAVVLTAEAAAEVALATEAMGTAAAATQVGLATEAAAAATAAAETAAPAAGLGPWGWAIIVGAADEASSMTWDCWKAVVHDQSTTPSAGITLTDLVSHANVHSFEILQSSGIITNVWGERYTLTPVVVGPGGDVALHAHLA